MARRRRKNESGIDVLLSLPWQVSMIFGVAIFAGMKWMLPAMWSNNMFLKPMAAAFSGIAWLFGGFFLLIGAVAFAAQKMAASKALVTGSKPVFGGGTANPEWKQPRWAKPPTPQGRSEPIDIGWGGADSTNAAKLRLHGEPTARMELSIEGVAKPTDWSIELIRKIEWKRFEDLCQQFYQSKGIKSETTPLGPDGGIDIRLYQDDSGKATSIVQCKAWGERFVGVKPVRELLGVMTHEKIDKAFFMTSGRFSDDAKAVATSNRITLVDGAMLLMMIQRLPVDVKMGLLAFATEGDYATPTCPSCGIKMRSVAGKGGKPDFWGCRNYPKCRQILHMRRSDS